MNDLEKKAADLEIAGRFMARGFHDELMKLAEGSVETLPESTIATQAPVALGAPVVPTTEPPKGVGVPTDTTVPAQVPVDVKKGPNITAGGEANFVDIGGKRVPLADVEKALVLVESGGLEDLAAQTPTVATGTIEEAISEILAEPAEGGVGEVSK